MKAFFVVLFLLLAAWVPLAQAVSEQNTGDVNCTKSVTSSAAATELWPSKRNGVRVMLDASASGALWVMFQNKETDCSAITTNYGVRLTASSGYDFLTADDGWTGKVCAKLESGATAIIAQCEAY
jgi:hypothetical protein